MAQPGLANLFSNPMALLQIAGGFMQPGPTQGARLGAGLANIAPTMATMMQLQQMQKQQEKQTQMEEALERMADPTMAAYKPTTEVTDPYLRGTNLAANPEYAQTGMDLSGMQTKAPQHSMMGDFMRVSPGSVIEAKMKQLTDPMSGYPDEVQKLMIFAQNPELAEFAQMLDPTGPMASLQAAGLKPGTPEAREFLANRGRSTVQIENKQESAFEGAEGTRYSSQVFGPLSTAAVSSNVELQKIARAKDLLANFNTGPTGDWRRAGAALAQEFGLDPTKYGLDKAAPAEALKAMSGDFILAAMERLKGVASDSDVKMLREMQVNIGNTPEGNLLILDLAERLWSRANAVNEVAQNYLSASGGKPRGVENAIKKYWAENPLYGPDEAKNISSFLGNVKVPNSPAHISIMSPEELAKLDVTKMTKEQAAAFRKRAMMLNATGK